MRNYINEFIKELYSFCSDPILSSQALLSPFSSRTCYHQSHEWFRSSNPFSSSPDISSIGCHLLSPSSLKYVCGLACMISSTTRMISLIFMTSSWVCRMAFNLVFLFRTSHLNFRRMNATLYLTFNMIT